MTTNTRRVSAVSAIYVFIATLLLVLLYDGPSAGDDTFIYMRYVRNALAGRGFVFNPGEPSYGCTSALWAFVMTPLVKLAGNTIWTWKIVSSVIFALRASILYQFFATFRIHTAAVLLLTLSVTAEPHSLRWGGSGMENSLALFLLTLAGIVFWKLCEKPSLQYAVSLGLILGLLPFARPELAPLAIVIAIGVASAAGRGRVTTVFCLAGALSAGSMAVLVWVYFGAVIPQSAEAKALFLQSSVPYFALLHSFKIVLSGCAVPLVLLSLSPVKSRAARFWVLASCVCLTLAVLYLGYQNHLVSTRYASYLCAPLMLGASIVAAEGMANADRRRTYWGAILVAHLALSVAILVYLFPATRAGDYRDINQVATAVARMTGAEARIAASEVGALGFYSDRYIIDLDGLTDRATLAWRQQHRSTMRREDIFAARRADYYVDSQSAESAKVIKKGDMTLTPLFEHRVRRDLLVLGQPLDTIWRVYRVSFGK